MEQERVLALYDAYADGVYRVALGYLRSAHDAEDAVQAVFCRLLEKELTIWPGRERAFLTKLTINHCKNQLAAAKRFAPEALDELSDSIRQHGILQCLEGYSFSEIAGLLQLTPSAVSMRLHRARKMLREQLGRDQ